jgi:hypothetical protein
LEILQSYIVRFLKERIRGEKDGSRGGRGRGRGRPKRGAGGMGRGGAPVPGAGSGPFTTTPLPPPNSVAPLLPPVMYESASGSGIQGKEMPSINGAIPSAINSQGPLPALETAVPPAPIPIPSSTSQTGPGHTSESPIIIVDDVDADEREGPAMKKRRLDGQGGAIAV